MVKDAHVCVLRGLHSSAQPFGFSGEQAVNDDVSKAKETLARIFDTPAVVEVMSPSMEPEISPTGDPLASFLKGNVGKVLFGVISTAAVVLPLVPSQTIFAKILSIVVGLGGAIGIASPGLRKPQA